MDISYIVTYKSNTTYITYINTFDTFYQPDDIFVISSFILCSATINRIHLQTFFFINFISFTRYKLKHGHGTVMCVLFSLCYKHVKKEITCPMRGITYRYNRYVWCRIWYGNIMIVKFQIKLIMMIRAKGSNNVASFCKKKKRIKCGAVPNVSWMKN